MKAILVPGSPESARVQQRLLTFTEKGQQHVHEWNPRRDSTDCSCVLPFWHGALERTRLECVWSLESNVRALGSAFILEPEE